METKTTIKKMLKEGRIVVPGYQRAYSWESAQKGEEPLHVNVFLADLEQYATLQPGSYYLGHFLFETTNEKTSDGDETLAVVDGQQRLTTITIFLSAVFSRLREIRPLSEEERHLEEDLVRRGRNTRFETVGHDRLFFREYVLDQSRTNREKLPFVSQRRIADAADCIRAFLRDKSEQNIVALLETIASAKCTTDAVDDSGEAMQMFLFQNNRGKTPSKLDVVKALLMRTACLHGGRERDAILRDMDDRFSEVFRYLSEMEDYVDEDEVLHCACRLDSNSLYAEASLSEIESRLTKGGLTWAEEFTRRIGDCFRELRGFFVDESDRMLEAYALRQVGCGGWALPIIVRARSLGLTDRDRATIWGVLESLVVRHRMVGTRAILVSRVNDVFKTMSFETATSSLTERLKQLATTTDWWWAYWTDEALLSALHGEITDRPLSKFLLWRYENALIANNDQAGYGWKRFDEIVSPELEHIAPQTQPDENPASGYGDYEDKSAPENGIVSGHWLDSIGNHLILPKSHNCQIGNKPFKDKVDTYKHSEQQLEVGKIADERKAETGTLCWDKVCIERRRNAIVLKLMEIYSPIARTNI